MIHSLLATANDLNNWADRLPSKNLFPELIRRLVIATNPHLTYVAFTSQEGVQLGGWDGITNASATTAFVPAGEVGWELGTDKAKKGKADDDYSKRSQNPFPLTAANSTYIFCTLRRWKNTWAADQIAAGSLWQDVKVYTADQLATWLTEAIGVHLWVSELIGKKPSGVRTLEDYWLDWSEVTHPPTPSPLLVAGRQEATQKIYDWLQQASGTLSLQADTRREAVALLAAAIYVLPAAEQAAPFSRAVVVESAALWQELINSAQKLLLIPLFSEGADEAVAGATRRGHAVFLPLDHTGDHRHVDITLPRLHRRAAAMALEQAGFGYDRAEQLAGIARRSLAAFRRRLAVAATAQVPAWAAPQYANTLLTAALLGTWDEQINAGYPADETRPLADQRVVAELGGLPYEQIATELRILAALPDPPVRLVGTVWYVVDKRDAWALHHRHLPTELLTRFADLALRILGTPIPKYELPPADQQYAALRGLSAPNSGYLRKGIADSLALLATDYPDTPAHHTVTRIVRELLAQANQQPYVWSSLNQMLPLLAEAEPDIFLAAVDTATRGTTPPLAEIFIESTGLFYNSSPHTGMLWALETLAWHPDYLTYVAKLLAALMRLEAGREGNSANRPHNSLREIFLPWLPHTKATLAQRATALDAVIRAEPDHAWRLLQLLLPQHHGVSSNTAKPKWRDWAPDENRRLLPADVYAGYIDVTMRVIGMAAEIPARWADLIKQLPAWLPDQRIEGIQHIQQLANADLTEEQRILLCGELRHVIHYNRRMPKAADNEHDETRLPTTETAQFEVAYHALQPFTPLGRYGWLFTNHPLLLTGYPRNHDEYSIQLTAERRAAITELVQNSSLEEALSLIPEIEQPGVLGATLMELQLLTDQQQTDFLGQYLAHDNPKYAWFARGLAIRNRIQRGEQGVQWALDFARTQAPPWRPDQVAVWFDFLPSNPTTWTALAAFDEETVAAYWAIASPYGIVDEASAVAEAFNEFLRHNRPLAAIHLNRLHQNVTIPSAQLTDALEAVLYVAPTAADKGQISGDEFGDVLTSLAADGEVDRSRLARLEFQFLGILRWRHRSTTILEEELCQNPQFFADVLAMFASPRIAENLPNAAELTEVTETEANDTESVATEIVSNQQAAESAFHLLREWRTIPGLTNTDPPSAPQLIAWIEQAQSATRANGRAEIGESYIGQMLSGSPGGTDGRWPHEVVRDALEALANERIERGMEMGRYNSRGTTSRGIYDGGDQERDLAATYQRDANALASQWPRTAALLRRLASSYKSEAGREDTSAALDQDLD